MAEICFGWKIRIKARKKKDRDSAYIPVGLMALAPNG